MTYEDIHTRVKLGLLTEPVELDGMLFRMRADDDSLLTVQGSDPRLGLPVLNIPVDEIRSADCLRSAVEHLRFLVDNPQITTLEELLPHIRGDGPFMAYLGGIAFHDLRHDGDYESEDADQRLHDGERLLSMQLIGEDATYIVPVRRITSVADLRQAIANFLDAIEQMSNEDEAGEDDEDEL